MTYVTRKYYSLWRQFE